MEQKNAGAIWKKVVKTRNGNVEVLSIVIDDKRYTAWPNTYKKEGDRTPDYRLQVDNYEPKKEYSNPKKEEHNSDLPF